MDTPCPYKIEFLNVSPFYKEGRTERQMIKLAQEQESIYLTGAKIPFTYVSSLKSMARVPRVDGKYRLGKKYFNLLG